jgi:type VI secretion system protein ImpF
MGRTVRLQPLSVFDRLQDYEPDRLEDRFVGATEQIRQIKDGIRRDLEVLLNMQQPINKSMDSLPEIETSLLKYGTAGFHGLMLATKEQRYLLARSIQDLISVFEPRLLKVRVELGEGKSDNIRLLNLRIRAEFRFADDQEQIVFDTLLDPAIRQFKIESAS